MGERTSVGSCSGHFSVKKLEIKAGSRGGLQYHRLKNEVIHVISGQLTLRYDLGDGILREQTVGPNATIHFPPGFVHQECAVSDCVILEVSTPHFNDRVRVEAQYGLDDGFGLPSTHASEIELR